MAHIKQQIKRIKTNEKSKLRNSSIKSAMKTSFKAVITACNNNDKALATVALSNAYKKLDKAQAKGVVHKNFVNRHKSDLAAKVNAL